MDRYNYIKNNFDKLKEAQDLGIISINVLRDYEIYNAFNLRPDLCKICRYEVLAEEYGFKHSNSIKQIIESFK